VQFLHFSAQLSGGTTYMSRPVKWHMHWHSSGSGSWMLQHITVRPTALNNYINDTYRQRPVQCDAALWRHEEAIVGCCCWLWHWALLSDNCRSSSLTFNCSTACNSHSPHAEYHRQLHCVQI